MQSSFWFWPLAIVALVLGIPGNCRADVFYNFENTTPMRLPAVGSGGRGVGMADPYPSAINVSGVHGRLLNIQISLHGLSHTFPDDLGAVVVAPSGTSALLFSGAGSNIRAVNLTLTFDDNAAAELPLVGALTSGVYQPGANEWDDYFPDPGPGERADENSPPPWHYEFQPWLGEDPNGQWALYVVDALAGDTGSISRGWSITFQVVPEPSSVLGLALIGSLALARRSRKKPW